MQKTSSQNLMDWIMDHKKAVIGAVAAIAVIGIGVAVRESMVEKRMIAAATALHEAEEQLEKDLKVAGTTPVADVDRQLTTTVTSLKKIAADYSGMNAAWEAQFQLASLYLKHEARSGKAIPAFQDAIAAAPSVREKIFSLYSLAYAFESQGKFDEATRELDQAITLAQPYLKAEIALSRARLLARSGKTTEADKAFEQVSKDFANTDFGRKAEQWKALRTL